MPDILFNNSFFSLAYKNTEFICLFLPVLVKTWKVQCYVIHLFPLCFNKLTKYHFNCRRWLVMARMTRYHGNVEEASSLRIISCQRLTVWNPQTSNNFVSHDYSIIFILLLLILNLKYENIYVIFNYLSIPEVRRPKRVSAWLIYQLQVTICKREISRRELSIRITSLRLSITI